MEWLGSSWLPKVRSGKRRDKKGIFNEKKKKKKEP